MDENQENDKKVDDLVEKLINEHIDEQIGDSVDKNTFYEEVITEEILKKYDKDGNLREEVIEKIKPSVKAKVSDKIIKSKKEKLSKEIEGQEGNDAPKLDERQRKIVEDDIENKISEDKKSKEEAKEEIDIKKEVMVAVYQNLMEEYYILRNDINNGYNGRTISGDLISNDKLEVKLVMYQNYLRKIDINYKRRYGSFIAQENKDIANMENTLRYDDAKSEKRVNKVMNENIQAIAVIIDRMEELSEDIVRISANSSIMNDEAKREFDAMLDEYISLTCELNRLNPSVLEINEQISQREEVSQFKDRVIGTEYERTRDRKVGTGRTRKIEDENEKIERDTTENFNNKTQEGVRSSLDIANDLLEQFDDQIKTSPQNAMETLESAEIIINGSLYKDSRQKRIDEAKESYGEYSLQAECAAATKSDEEILKTDVEDLKQRAASLRDKINENKRTNDNMRR